MEGLNELKLFKSETIIADEYIVEINNSSKIGGSHHPNLSFLIRLKSSSSILFTMTVMSSPAGCGSVILYGTNLYIPLSDDLENIIKRIFNLYKQNGAGSFVTMLGRSYYNSLIYKAFEKLDFKIASEYPNHRHGGGVNTQRLLQLIL